MTKPIKFAALGIEHRHIFGMSQNMLNAGAEFAGWWTEGEPVSYTHLTLPTICSV